jgi:hypothetical protein
MIGFTDEISKEAGRVSDAIKAVRRFGGQQLAGRYGRQLALGAGVGGVTGAATAGEGATRGERLKRGLIGAAIGGGAAGGRIMATKAGRQAAKQGVKDFGEKQLYTVTGKGYKGRKIDTQEAQRLGILQKHKDFEGAVAAASDKPGMIEKAKSKLLGGKALSAQDKLIKERAAQLDAFRKGYHNVPGVIQGAVSDPKALLRSGWQRAGTTGKVFAGMGALGAAKGVVEKPEEGGPGRLEKGLRGAGSAVGYMVAPQAMLGSTLVGEGASSLAGGIGKGISGAVGAARALRGGGRVVPAQQQQQQEWGAGQMPQWQGQGGY